MRRAVSRWPPAGNDKLNRGDIRWADIDKRRPVVLVSRDEAYSARRLIIAAPATTKVRGYAVEVKIGRREGLDRECVINCDWLITLPKEDLLERAGALSGAKASPAR